MFSAPNAGTYTVTYTYSDNSAAGHYLNTATQTVTVVNPYYDGFENGATAIKVGLMKGTLLDLDSPWGSALGNEGEQKHIVDSAHGTVPAGTNMAYVSGTWKDRPVLFVLGEDMRSILKIGDTVSFKVLINADNLDGNSNLDAYIWSKSESTYTKSSVGQNINTNGKGKTWIDVTITLSDETAVNALKGGAIGIKFDGWNDSNYNLYFDDFKVTPAAQQN